MYNQAVPVPLSKLVLEPLLLLPRLAPLGKDAKELLPDSSALLLLSAAAVVVTAALGAITAAFANGAVLVP